MNADCLANWSALADALKAYAAEEATRAAAEAEAKRLEDRLAYAFGVVGNAPAYSQDTQEA